MINDNIGIITKKAYIPFSLIFVFVKTMLVRNKQTGRKQVPIYTK